MYLRRRPRYPHLLKLPVIFWIHGGGNIDGESAATTTAASWPLRATRLSSPSTTAWARLAFGGSGLGRRRPSLRQLRPPSISNLHSNGCEQNIAKFGGDPKNVTVGGQSAGSIDTEANLVSPLAKGLFQRAILQSVVVESSPLANAEAKGVAFAAAVGCGSGAARAVATCLRHLSVAQILALQGSYTVHPLGIVADGEILPAAPFTSLIAAGRFNHMPIMSGTTEDDLENFGLANREFLESPRVPFTAANYTAFVNSFTGSTSGTLGWTLGTFPRGTPAAVMAHYPLGAYSTPQLAMDAIGTDPIACEQRHHNRLLASRVPVYAYEFDDRTAPFYFPQMPGFLSLTYHTADIQYLFPLFHGGPLGTPHPLNAQQELLSDELVAAWTNFARTGNPNGSGNFPWPVYMLSNANTAILSEGLSTPQPKTISGITLPPSPPAPHPPGLSTYTDSDFNKFHQCDFWASILSY